MFYLDGRECERHRENSGSPALCDGCLNDLAVVSLLKRLPAYPSGSSYTPRSSYRIYGLRVHMIIVDDCGDGVG